MPIGPDAMRRALAQATGGGAEILFVHSSLSAFGHFTAGPEDVLAGLREFSGILGTPTHTYCYPEKPNKPGPLFNSATTPSRNGILTELFRRQPGVIRSIQSTHSLAIEGPQAEEICRAHYLNDTPCGAGTPYARLIERGTSALLFGVNFHAYTFYHTAEDAAGSAYAYEAKTIDLIRVVDENGRELSCQARRQTRNPRRFAECGDLMERSGLVRRVELGRSALLFVPDCAKAHDFLVERLRKTPDFLYLSCAAPLR